ncbi:H-NS histone family protein [Shimia sp. FJ5]|uniref:H-NS histone family protein n=1 Tax=Shimia sp. FJ5 TaxID=3079054 RepID=UPI00260886EF|nr:H-NS histone family protein [Shimia sp. FJ5]MDV4143256.1 H-NS histone family protein [Shimia sp. FJ5]
MTLDGMTRTELVELKTKIDIQLGRLEAQRKSDALEAARKAAEEFGFSLEELADAKKAKNGKLVKGMPKYADPKDISRTWTGKGRKPKWFDEALSAGIHPEDMEL